MNYHRESLRKADASIVSPSSELKEEWWGVVGSYGGVEELCHCWKYDDISTSLPGPPIENENEIEDTRVDVPSGKYIKYSRSPSYPN